MHHHPHSQRRDLETKVQKRQASYLRQRGKEAPWTRETIPKSKETDKAPGKRSQVPKERKAGLRDVHLILGTVTGQHTAQAGVQEGRLDEKGWQDMD